LEKMIGMDEGKINFGNNDDRQYRQSNSWEWGQWMIKVNEFYKSS
jgi:hypothetical protein